MNRLDTQRQLPISLIMADLNGLKMINDSYGHAFGDQFLIKAANILKNACRKEDIVARWGGDEFVILLPRTKRRNVKKIIRRINNLSHKEKEEIPVSMALGYAVKTKPEQDIYDVLSTAEDYMYQKKLTESKSAKSNILSTLINSLGAKSHETEEHAWRLQKLVFDLGEKLNLSERELNELSLLATLHDIGKTVIPKEILLKPGKLTEEEWQEIKKHPEIGAQIASATKEFAHVAETILYHHEHWDGSGYPEGIKGNNIPLLSRIVSIVDAYDVMTNGRSYKDPMTEEEAVQELIRCSGTQFDPDLVQEFIEIIN
ncbi:MAG: HD domain-containing phosphohydrolase [bacterium]